MENQQSLGDRLGPSWEKANLEDYQGGQISINHYAKKFNNTSKNVMESFFSNNEIADSFSFGLTSEMVVGNIAV